MDAELERLRSLVCVPGLWQCARCKFQLVQATLHASSGAVTSRDQPGDRCPNCNVPLWRVTERDAGNQLCDRLEQSIERERKLQAALRDVVSHWNEFGAMMGIADDYGLSEKMDAAERLLQDR